MFSLVVQWGRVIRSAFCTLVDAITDRLLKASVILMCTSTGKGKCVFVPAVTCSFFPILVYAYAMSNKLTRTGKNKMMVSVGGGFFLALGNLGKV